MAEAPVSTLTAQRPATAPASVAVPKRRSRGLRRNVLMFAVLAALAAGGFFAYRYFTRPDLPPGFASGNGRLEANQVFVSTKYPGRISQVLFNEGDTVDAGQVVARMDTTALEAQLREAQAQIVAAQDSRRVAQAQVAVRKADFEYAQKQYQRSQGLVPGGAVSEREAELDNASMLAAKGQLVGAQAQAVQTISAIDAATATADRLRAEIKDAVLTAPLRSRVETRLSETGEVLPAGGRVFSVNDLSDVYMYVYLPETVTGKLAVGSEARIVLDAAPEYPIRAIVSYVSPMAQFTPKPVETAEERHNLTFRVKLQIPRERLQQYEPLVKTGLPGVGYVRWDEKAPWPEKLQGKGAPPANLWKPTGATGGPN
jgi:HlyD family secretion protein